MNVQVKSYTPAPPPPQRVLLDLSVEEFALIFRLYYKHFSGKGRIRDQFADGLYAAADQLNESNRQKVNGVAKFLGDCVTAVEEWFRS